MALGGPTPKNYVEIIELELQQLRPRLDQQRLLVADRHQAYQAARRERAIEVNGRRREEEAKLHARVQLVKRLQGSVRRWLLRRRFFTTVDSSLMDHNALAAKLPHLLSDQLLKLQHNVHALVYRPEDHFRAVLRLQSWWRGVLAQRLMRILHMADKAAALQSRMHAAATRLQAWFRGVTQELRMREQIRINVERTRRQKQEEIEHSLNCVFLLQSYLRAKLARMRTRERASRGELPAGVAALALMAPPAEALEGAKAVAAEVAESPAEGAEAPESPAPPPMHKPFREVRRIEEAGLVPFYSSGDGVVRHRIGGVTAHKFHQQLAARAARREAQVSEDPTSADGGGALAASADGGIGVPEEEEEELEDIFCDKWNMYPDGLSRGFIKGLDSDVWAGRGWPGRRRKQTHAKRAPRRARPRCTAVLAQPPANAQLRAAAREAALETKRGAEEEHGLAGGPSDTQLPFVNAPELPKKQLVAGDSDEDGSWAHEAGIAPPPGPPPPRYRRHRKPRSGVAKEEDDCGWQLGWSATSEHACDRISGPFGAAISMARLIPVAVRNEEELLWDRAAPVRAQMQLQLARQALPAIAAG